MRRRDFLAASCVAGIASLGNVSCIPGHTRSVVERARAKGGKEILELRLYKMDAGPKEKLLEDFLRKAAIPAWNRLGIEPVGVFKMPEGKGPDVYVLLPHKSMESVVTANTKLMADAKFLKAGAPFLNATKRDPAFKRIESSLMLSFDKAPRVETAIKNEMRIFQLRIYESHNAERAKKKVEMFNTGGEIDIFRKYGMQPVFFGETLIGTKFPNLTYMIVFENMDARKANWDKFVNSPEWKKLSKDPAYKDTVSNITNIFLRPAACSQI